MGFAVYYKRFIESSRIVNPKTSLQKRNVKFIWSQKCEESLKLLKEMLTCSLVLKIPNLNKEYMVCMIALLEWLGGFFMQKGYVILYESQKLKDHKKNYATHVLELDVVVHPLQMWRNYLLGI